MDKIDTGKRINEQPNNDNQKKQPEKQQQNRDV